MNQRHAPALERACRFLHEEIERCRTSGTPLLRATRILAQECGVSGATLSKAVALLRVEGSLLSVKGRGLMVPVEPGTVDVCAPPVEPLLYRTARWLAIRERIDTEVANGTFQPGMVLPTLKELAARYETSYPSVKRALESLVDQKKLVPHKKGYRVYRFEPVPNKPVVVYFSLTQKEEILSAVNRHTSGLLRLIEEQLMAAGIALEVVGYYELLGVDSRKVSLKQLQKRHNVLGYLVNVSRFKTAEATDLLTRIAATGKPASIIDQGDIKTDWSVVRGNPLFRSFWHMGGAKGGKLLGEHLLECGHRNVAYFSIVNDTRDVSPTLHRRLGLERAFARGGLSRAVHHFCSDRFSSYLEASEHFGTVEPFKTLQETGAVYSEQLDKIDVLPGTYIRPAAVRTEIEALYWYQEMVPKFAKALARTEITAWVGFNDVMALLFLTWFGREGVRVPEDISVVGFDDTIEAFGYGLTSYNFNAPGLVTKALDHIIRYRVERKLPNPFYEVPGRVMARGTTGVPTYS